MLFSNSAIVSSDNCLKNMLKWKNKDVRLLNYEHSFQNLHGNIFFEINQFNNVASINVIVNVKFYNLFLLSRLKIKGKRVFYLIGTPSV